MEEKCMVNDILENTKRELLAYQDIISECENINLRQTIQQIRNNKESFQYELLKTAEVKDYYKNTFKATEKEIDLIKKEINNY